MDTKGQPTDYGTQLQAKNKKKKLIGILTNDNLETYKKVYQKR